MRQNSKLRCSCRERYVQLWVTYCMYRTGLSWCIRFFFSSRRRHTRFKCDWSSDVCSSDLYTVSIRYPRDFRSNPQAIANQVLVPLPDGGTVPLGEVTKVSLAEGPSSIRTENAQLTAYIYVDFRDRDLGGYVADAQSAVATQIKFPPGYFVTWSGQFEYLERAKAPLQTVVPFTVLIIFLLLYLNFRRVTETLILMLSVPFALVGGLWLLWWLC